MIAEVEEATDCPACGYTQSRGTAGTHYDVVHNSLTGGLRCIRCEYEWAVV